MSRIAAIFLILTLPLSAAAQGRTIYGEDDRLDFFEVSDPGERAAMSKAVSVFRATALEKRAGFFLVKGSVFGSASRRLCPGQRFFEQRAGASCSGTLIGPDLVLTAGHCMGAKDKPADKCPGARFVFGFLVDRQGEVPGRVRDEDVYSCAKVEIYANSKNADYAVVRLDRRVDGRVPAPVYLDEPPAEGRRVFTVGGPYGLPLKVVGNGEVRSVDSRTGSFRTNLDTSGGNSGGGIFSYPTGQLLGVHTASYDPDLVEVPLPDGHGLPFYDTRVLEGKCKIITRLGEEEGGGKKAYALSAIPGLAALLRTGRSAGEPDTGLVRLPIPDITLDQPDLSRFGSLP